MFVLHCRSILSAHHVCIAVGHSAVITEVNNHKKRYYSYDEESDRTHSGAELHTTFGRGCDGQCGVRVRTLELATGTIALGRYVEQTLYLYYYEEEYISGYGSDACCCMPAGELNGINIRRCVGGYRSLRC